VDELGGHNVSDQYQPSTAPIGAFDIAIALKKKKGKKEFSSG
jgi:hypothetical protein